MKTKKFSPLLFPAIWFSYKRIFKKNVEGVICKKRDDKLGSVPAQAAFGDLICCAFRSELMKFISS